jgi:Fic family protein
LIKTFHYNIGKNLGEHLRAAPGQFRNAGHNVVVGSYKPPLGKDVIPLVIRLCDWLKGTFHYEDGKQNFIEQVIQAVVCHVYIAWIHPFGDGNGRTARLIEFYLLLRAGLPDIARISFPITTTIPAKNITGNLIWPVKKKTCLVSLLMQSWDFVTVSTRCSMLSN